MALIQSVASVGDGFLSLSPGVNEQQIILDVLTQRTALGGSAGFASFATLIQSLTPERQQQIRQAILAYENQLAGYQRAVLSAWNIYLNKHWSNDPASMFGQWKDPLGDDINRVQDQRRLLRSMLSVIPK